MDTSPVATPSREVIYQSNPRVGAAYAAAEEVPPMSSIAAIDPRCFVPPSPANEPPAPSPTRPRTRPANLIP